MTRSSTSYTRGDVVLVPFGFGDRDTYKLRPALVLSSNAYHQNRHDMIVAAMTTRVREPLLVGDYRLQDWQGSGLPKPSVVTAVLRTVKSYLVLMKLGELPPSELDAVEAQLRVALAL